MDVKDTVSTYRLRPEDLGAYLKLLFRRDIPVHVSAEGESIYWFKVPRPLSLAEKEHIYVHVRYSKDDDNIW
ncbi:hypothetical protein F4811DRAFT_550169 [Daldinia bambusicola]|nr:hypothetical protein F4811DRAFT_550169 [Daldinia bambusicola]